MQLADYLKMSIRDVLEFTEEEFLMWIWYLRDKQQKEQHAQNVARMRSKTRR
tara:strand:- start:389 stop:544 length:156 start_codon:yes stop_codon:yes gene_type:complete